MKGRSCSLTMTPATAAALAKPVVTPLCINAAQRKSFEAIVRVIPYAGAVKLAVLNALPLERNGWRFKGMTVFHIGTADCGDHIWRITRGAQQ